MALSSNEWAAQIAKRVGQRVAHYRAQAPGEKTKQGITAQALADRCTALGMPMDRTVIAKLEKGTRQTITVGEVIVFARALEVPPVALLFDLGNPETVEVLPGKDADSWSALKWFTGEASRLPDEQPSPQAESGAEAVRLFRRHDQLVTDWRNNHSNLQQLIDSTPGRPDGHLARLAAEAINRIAEAIKAVRGDMRSLGLTPPDLAPDLAYIETPPLDRDYEPLPEEDQT